MKASISLLETVQGLIERTFLFDSGLVELAPFIVGDRAWRRMVHGWAAGQPRVGSGSESGAVTFVRETSEGVRAGIYFPDPLIECLEAFPPQRGIQAENVAAFATFVEEIDHLLVLAERVRLGRPVSIFELELHANVSKYLVLGRFLAGRSGRLDPGARLWLRREVFGEARFQDDDPVIRERYREAARWSIKLLEAVERREPETRLRDLRAFHWADGQRKLHLIARIAS